MNKFEKFFPVMSAILQISRTQRVLCISEWGDSFSVCVVYVLYTQNIRTYHPTNNSRLTVWNIDRSIDWNPKTKKIIINKKDGFVVCVCLYFWINNKNKVHGKGCLRSPLLILHQYNKSKGYWGHIHTRTRYRARHTRVNNPRWCRLFNMCYGNFFVITIFVRYNTYTTRRPTRMKQERWFFIFFFCKRKDWPNIRMTTLLIMMKMKQK